FDLIARHLSLSSDSARTKKDPRQAVLGRRRPTIATPSPTARRPARPTDRPAREVRSASTTKNASNGGRARRHRTPCRAPLGPGSRYVVLRGLSSRRSRSKLSGNPPLATSSRRPSAVGVDQLPLVRAGDPAVVGRAGLDPHQLLPASVR